MTLFHPKTARLWAPKVGPTVVAPRRAGAGFFDSFSSIEIGCHTELASDHCDGNNALETPSALTVSDRADTEDDIRIEAVGSLLRVADPVALHQLDGRAV
jgi:hypothetical protein